MYGVIGREKEIHDFIRTPKRRKEEQIILLRIGRVM